MAFPGWTRVHGFGLCWRRPNNMVAFNGMPCPRSSNTTNCVAFCMAQLFYEYCPAFLNYVGFNDIGCAHKISFCIRADKAHRIHNRKILAAIWFCQAAVNNGLFHVRYFVVARKEYRARPMIAAAMCRASALPASGSRFGCVGPNSRLRLEFSCGLHNCKKSATLARVSTLRILLTSKLRCSNRARRTRPP